MLTPEYLKTAPDIVINQFRILEDDVIKQVAEQVKRGGMLSSTSLYQLNLMHDIEQSTKYVNKLIDDGMAGIGKTTGQLITESAKFTYADDIEKFQRYSNNILPEFQNNDFVKNITDGIKMQTSAEIGRLSKSKGFMVGGKFTKADDIMRDIMNRSIFNVSSGLFTYEEMARQYIKQLGDSGIRTIDFENGATREIESHLRRIIVDATRQLSNNISNRNAQDLGTDLMEISAHSGARPTHAEWQGEIVSLSGNSNYLSTDDIGYGDVTGFGGANCRHSWYPYFEGADRNYSKAELDFWENERVTIDGKEVSMYEATQKQRRYERAIRSSKRRLEGFKVIGDSQAVQQEKIRLNRLTGGYRDISAQAGLKEKPRFLGIYKKE